MKKILIVTLIALIAIFVNHRAQAAVVTLDGAGDSGSINGALFFQGWPYVSGTGNLDPFLRIQTGKEGPEQGYNTDGTVPWETKSGSWTSSIRLDAISTIAINGSLYREFILDMGQNDDRLSLDEAKIYLNSSTGSITGEDLTPLGAAIFNLDQLGDSYVDIHYPNSGNGRADMTMYIPNSLFTGTNPYVYLYTKFGVTYPANDGFEEWAVRETPTHETVPEPASLSLLGLGLLGLAGFGRKGKK